MGDTVIRVENLGKKYLIRHQLPAGQATLKDYLVDSAKALGQRIRHLGGKSSKNNEASREEFWALKDVSFEVKQGDRLGVIGRNGAGKSTLLKILSQITEPTTGEIRIQGRIASLLEVGTGFHPDLTGRENIFLNGSILGMSKTEIKQKFDEIVAFSEIEKFLDTPVKRYSSGMYVRLAFSVAAHLDPEILIIDEVLAVGDSSFQQKCLTKIDDFSRQDGKVIFFVSHNMQAVRRLCNHVLLLDKGTAITNYTVEDAIQKYLSKSYLSNFNIELDSLPRSSGLGVIARLNRIQLLQNTTLSYGKPLGLLFTIECFYEVNDLVIGIGFDTLEGNRIMTLDSDHNHPPLRLSKGIHDIKFYLDRNPLNPGIYSIGVTLLSKGNDLDTAPLQITWEVISDEKDLITDRGYGGCRLAVNVAVT